MTLAVVKRDRKTFYRGNDTQRVMARGYVRLPEAVPLKGHFYMAAHAHDPCIVLYPSTRDEKVYSVTVWPPKPLNIDRYHKIKLPEEFLQSAQLVPGESRVIIAGIGNYIEIWNKENWDDYIQKILQKPWTDEDRAILTGYGFRL